MLSEAIPELRNSVPGAIHVPALPDLHSIVVVDDQGEFDMKCTTDWREILVWQRDAKTDLLRKNIAASLHKDDVINLQFTRFAARFSYNCMWHFTDLAFLSGTTGSPKAVSVKDVSDCLFDQLDSLLAYIHIAHTL